MAIITEINGLTVPSVQAFMGLLDNAYGSGAAAAYSIRRINSATTVLLRVRRETAGGTGDDDEADVAYDFNNILSLDSAISNASAGVTATTLGQFINVGTVGGTTYSNPDSLTVTASCFVDEWKDQSGNANDATQATHASQPQIHDGTVNTDLITDNGKPALDFANDELTSSFNLTSDQTVAAVVNSNTAGIRTLFSSAGGVSMGRSANNAFYQSSTSGDTDNFYGTYVTDDQQLHFVYRDSVTSSNSFGRINGTQDGLDIDGTGTCSGAFKIGQLQFSGYSWEGFVQELILWNNQSSNKTAIEENINSEYLIYQPTTQPTSGLLYDYGSATGGTDAAAAYSVRQLSDKAVLCMRIRRDMGAGNPGHDDEINIGFDANGDLDTAAISAFCGTGTGYVTRWWDQSVNGNHADQAVPDSQPQIYNGTAVITANGKPAVSAEAVNNSGFTISLGLSQPFTSFNVGKSNGTGTAFYYGFSPQINASYNSNIYAGSGLNTTVDLRNEEHIMWAVFNGANSKLKSIKATQSQEVSGSAGTDTNFNYLLRRRSTDQDNYLLANELIFWDSEQSSTNLSGIESNLDSYYAITS